MTLLPDIGSLILPYPDGSLLRLRQSKQIFLIAKSSKRLIVNGRVFTNHGFKFEDVIVLDEAEVLDYYPTGPNLTE